AAAPGQLPAHGRWCRICYRSDSDRLAGTTDEYRRRAGDEGLVMTSSGSTDGQWTSPLGRPWPRAWMELSMVWKSKAREQVSYKSGSVVSLLNAAIRRDSHHPH